MTRRSVAILSAALGAIAVLSVCAWLFASRTNTNRQAQVDDRGKQAAELVSTPDQPLPPYRMANLDQQEIPDDELRHGRVLLFYLTTGCEPCVKETEVVSRLYNDAPPGLRIYGVSIERPAQVATFVREFGLKFPMLIDMGSQLARSLDIHYFPSKYLIEDGVIKKVWRGATRDEAEFRRELGIK